MQYDVDFRTAFSGDALLACAEIGEFLPSLQAMHRIR
jgi:hypothetical protein